MVQEKYGVQLSTQEKGRLRQMIRAGRSSARAITRARILLKTDQGWKKALIQGAPHHFENGAGRQEKDQEVLTAQLYQQIGQLKVERDFLSRSFGL